MTRNAGAVLAAVLTIVMLLVGVRVARNNQLTSDDMFFFDAGRALLEEGRLALPMWGDARRHASFLASYPPLAPAVAALDVWLVGRTGNPYLTRSTAAILLLVAAAVLWRVLPIPDPVLRGAVVLLCAIEPVALIFFTTLRPEALLIILMLALFVATESAVRTPSGRTIALLTGLCVAAALTHWQMVFTLAYVMAALLLSAVYRRRLSGPVIACVLAVAATYSAYAYFILASPVRREAFAAQMLAVGSASGLVRKAQFLAANVLVGNLADGSGFSVYLVAALAAAAATLVGLGRGIGREQRYKALHALLFMAAGLVPALYVDYIGPRAIPLYLVSVVYLIGVAREPGRRTLVIASLVAGSLANWFGHIGLQVGYFDRPFTGAVVAIPLVWLTGALLLAWGRERWSASLRVSTAAATVLIVGITSYVSSILPGDAGMTAARLAEARAALDRPDIAGARVLCDVRVHYLPLWLNGHAARIDSTFPLLYFRGAEQLRAFTRDMRPDVLLMSSAFAGERDRAGDQGRLFSDWTDAEFRPADVITIAGQTTMVYARR